jgi:hypothetical protein
MRECAERLVEVGFTKSPKKVIDKIERVTAQMLREGWELAETRFEESLGNVHLFFERELKTDDES